MSLSISNQWVPGRRSASPSARTEPGAPSASCVCVCVCVQGKIQATDCLLPSVSLQLTNSVSLPLQTLDLNLLRIQRRRKQQRQPQAAGKSSSSLTAAPRCTILPAGSSSRPQLPSSSSQVAHKALSPGDGKVSARREGIQSAWGTRTSCPLRTNAHMQAGSELLCSRGIAKCFQGVGLVPVPHGRAVPIGRHPSGAGICSGGWLGSGGPQGEHHPSIPSGNLLL